MSRYLTGARHVVVKWSVTTLLAPSACPYHFTPWSGSCFGPEPLLEE
ncbi:MAG: hypothetical protein AVDCRST_MAG64-554 [uncultured Phycisphaerae bacterium]|uniref:Uncharacterized protein n=1 Tax=uncultured Phycisphaerae bacterium TaxID=904963 RepID=A0A6J4NDL9_9BACT|nr:MAG: hypothetical protein AVDCRST_MAG64-554 [uncultured Phycisphaerae bacterium]